MDDSVDKVLRLDTETSGPYRLYTVLRGEEIKIGTVFGEQWPNPGRSRSLRKSCVD